MEDEEITTAHERLLEDLLSTAWGIIANAHGGDWVLANAEWRGAAARWRDRYFATLPGSPEDAAETSPLAPSPVEPR